MATTPAPPATAAVLLREDEDQGKSINKKQDEEFAKEIGTHRGAKEANLNAATR